MASLKWIRELDNSLRHSVQRRLFSFVFDIEKIRKLIVDASLTAATLLLTAPILSLTSDQAPWQVCASEYLKFNHMVNLVNHWDAPAHRIHNDWKVA